MDDMFLRQRAAQQPEGPFPRGMDDIVLRQQQLLQEQYKQSQQQQRNSNMMQDFQLPSQGQYPGMPSLMEISRAEEILQAAREAITANSATGRTAATCNQYASMPSEDYPLSRSRMNPPEGRWASAYAPTPLRPPGPQVNAPISTGGLGNPDLQLLLSKQQNQGMSLATANAPQPSPMAMRQAMMNQMPSENMGVLESLLLRQEEERLFMGKRQRTGDDSSPRPKKYGGTNFPAIMEPQPLPPQMVAAANKDMMQAYDSNPKPRKRRAKTFPVKLMECLMAYYDERYFGWLPDGRSFVIIHPEQFIDNIISRTFKNSKYASFVRKLNRWGFARLTSGTGTDCFYHPLFQRDRIDLAAQMLCMPRNDSVSAKKRAKLGIETPSVPIVTAADVDPQDRPSLAGVERFFSGKEQGGSPKGSNAGSDSDDDARADRKQAAVSSPETGSSSAPARAAQGGDKASSQE